MGFKGRQEAAMEASSHSMDATYRVNHEKSQVDKRPDEASTIDLEVKPGSKCLNGEGNSLEDDHEAGLNQNQSNGKP